MMTEPFATQSEAFRRGYRWAGDLSDNKPGIDAITERYGYEIDMPEFVEFLNGADVKQAEQLGDTFGYDIYDDEDEQHD